MNNPLMFMVEVMRQALWIRVWVVYMLIVNAASLLFWEQGLAQLIFYVFLLSASFMLGLYSWFGYERILGLGHVLWIPLLYWLAREYSTVSGDFKLYVTVLMVTNGLSLVFDVADVWRYFKSN